MSIPAKVCKKCGTEKPASVEFFHKAPGNKDGLTSKCKACRAADAKVYYPKNRESKATNSEAWRQLNPEKVCTQCGATKPATPEYFDKYAAAPSGLRAVCKPCRVPERKAYRQENRERERETQRAWKEANPEKVRQYARDFYHRNPEAAVARTRAWEKANPEKLRLQKKREYERNPEPTKARVRTWNLENPGRSNERARIWCLENPEKAREHGAANARKRYARKRNAEGTHTAADVGKQFTLQGGKCHWCGCKLVKSGNGKYPVDHVIALAKGGSNGPENIVCSCPICNRTKSAKSPLEFAGRLF